MDRTSATVSGPSDVGTNSSGDGPASSPTSANLACITCGYDLTGVTIGEACPECGTSVAATIRAGRAMTRSQAVAVVLRLVALWIAFQCLTIIDFLAYIVMALSGLSSSVSLGPDALTLFVFQLMPLLVRFAVAVVLWITAYRVASWLVRNDGKLSESTRLHGRSLLSVGLILIGVFALIRGSSALITVFAREGLDLGINNRYLGYSMIDSSLLGSAFWLIAGLLLCGSPRLRGWLSRDLPRD